MANSLHDILSLARYERASWDARLASLVLSGVPLNADTATFGAAMKTKFLGPIRDYLPKGMVLLFGDPAANPTDFRGILPNAENIDMVGNEFRIPFKTERNNSVGFRSENETLPAPGSSKYSYLQEPIRHAYALFNITGQLLRASESNEGAFRSAFKAEMEDTLLASKLDFNFAAHGDSTGKRAQVVTGGSGVSSIVVDTTVRFRGGEMVDFVSTAGVVISNAHRVTAINRATKTLTITPVTAANVTAAHYIVRASSDSTIAVPNNSQFKEINGLENIVAATGSLHGFNPTTYDFWASYIDSSGGNISDRKMRDAKDNVGFTSGADVESGLNFALVTTRGIRARYGDTLTTLKRFNNEASVKLHGGYTALMFDENPIFIDDATTPGVVWGLALNRFFWSQMSDWDWLDQDGKVLKWESRKDRYVAVLFKYCNLGTLQRNAHFKLTGLADDAR